MKKYFLLVLFFSVLLPAQSLSEIRKAFPEAYKNKELASNFYTLTEGTPKSVVLQAYRSAGMIIKAKFEKPEQRKKMLKEGIISLEEAIKKDPNNAEIRLIRLSIQENLPKFIKYNNEIKNDKKFLIDHYENQEPSVKNLIKNFKQHSKTFLTE